MECRGVERRRDVDATLSCVVWNLVSGGSVVVVVGMRDIENIWKKLEVDRYHSDEKLKV